MAGEMIDLQDRILQDADNVVNQSSRRPELHLAYNFFYVTILLGSIIVVLVSHKWTPQPKFTEYLGNAATLASLLLALVAIVYSFVSSEGISKSLGQISSIASAVSESRDEVRELIKTAKALNDSSEESIRLNKETSERIGNDLTILGEVVTSLQSGSRDLQDTVGKLPLRLGQIEGRFDGIEQILNEKRQPDERRDANQPSQSVFTTEESVLSFLESSSLDENLLTIAVVLACRSEKPLSIDDFCRSIGASVKNKSIGFVACMEALGIVQTEIESMAPRAYYIEEVNELLSQRATEYFQDYLQRVKSGNPDHYAKWSGKYESVKRLFPD
jgi:hypothetical protein